MISLSLGAHVLSARHCPLRRSTISRLSEGNGEVTLLRCAVTCRRSCSAGRTCSVVDHFSGSIEYPLSCLCSSHVQSVYFSRNTNPKPHSPQSAPIYPHIGPSLPPSNLRPQKEDTSKVPATPAHAPPPPPLTNPCSRSHEPYYRTKHLTPPVNVSTNAQNDKHDSLEIAGRALLLLRSGAEEGSIGVSRGCLVVYCIVYACVSWIGERALWWFGRDMEDASAGVRFLISRLWPRLQPQFLVR